MNTAHEQRQQLSHVVIQPSLPLAVITGDLRFAVTESDAARGPISGNYRIETREMQESFWVLWGTEGQVQNRHARVTEIIFALAGARVGQLNLESHTSRILQYKFYYSMVYHFSLIAHENFPICLQSCSHLFALS